MDLSGFKAFDFSAGWPYFSVTKNGMTFSKAVTVKLGFPEYTRFLINQESKQVALQVCGKNDANATAFYRARKSNIFSVRWNSHDLIATMERLLGESLEKAGYRVDGELIDETTMLFDLNKAKRLD